MKDSAGALIEAGERTDVSYSKRGTFHLQLLLGNNVESYSVHSPESFSLRFNSGHSLTFFDDSSKYESFSIQPGDIFV